jgi:hypothetical protein
MNIDKANKPMSDVIIVSKKNKCVRLLAAIYDFAVSSNISR